MEDETPEAAIARKILQEILDSPGPDADYGVEQNEDGEQVFVSALESDLGIVEVAYLPSGLVEALMVKYDAKLDKLLDDLIIHFPDGHQEKINTKPIRQADREALVQAFAKVAARVFIECMNRKIGQGLAEWFDESFALAGQTVQATFAKTLHEHEDVSVEIVGDKEEFNKLVEEGTAEQKNFLFGSYNTFREHYSPKPTLDEINERINAVLPLWQAAKKARTRYRKEEPGRGWVSRIAKEYPTLPVYLIKRLGDLKGGSPSELARADAERWCGVPQGHRSIRHYSRVRRASKIETNTSDADH